MHGYFIDIRLYRKAKSVAEPFAIEEYRRRKIREKIEEDRANRVQIQVILNSYLLNKRSVCFFYIKWIIYQIFPTQLRTFNQINLNQNIVKINTF